MTFKITPRLPCVVVAILLSQAAAAQRLRPIHWNFTYDAGNKTVSKLVITAVMDDGWHVYSQFMGHDGPLPTTFTFQPSKDYALIGKVVEENVAYKSYDSTFLMEVIWFEKKAVFSQEVKLKSPATIIKGSAEFMACKDDLCLPPEKIEFSIPINGEKRAEN